MFFRLHTQQCVDGCKHVLIMFCAFLCFINYTYSSVQQRMKHIKPVKHINLHYNLTETLVQESSHAGFY